LEGGEVVVLSPYQGQVDLISEILSESVPVFTVDGYQGKEADYIVLSLVRNNEKTATRRWGFVSDPNRLNVALSRAREGLIILTSLEHLKGSEFHEGNDHLSQAIQLLSERGVVLTVDDLGGGN
jgi:superfamily I DNA and/or RNA helicase